jgi:uncharacterized protein (TIGR03083 family)
MNHLEYCDLLEPEIERFAQVLEITNPDLPIPSCPGWSATELAAHMGEVHRWSEHLVRVVAPGRIGAGEMGLDQGPPTPEWIRQGGTALLATLRAADPDAAMWAWGGDQHARFWSWRELHETIVHRIDLEIAGGRVPNADAAVAADGIDELLDNLPGSAYFSPKVRLLKGQGQRLGLRAEDTGGTWTITLTPAGFEVGPGGDHDALVSGPALPLLLVAYRRWPLAS